MGMVETEQQFARTIASLYDAALDASGASWTHAVANVSSALGADDKVVLAIQRGALNFGVISHFGMDTASSVAYESEFAAQDPAIEPALRVAPPGTFVASHEQISNPAFERSAFYNEFLRPHALYYGGASVLVHHGTSQALLYLTRSRMAGPYERTDDAMLARLLPHVQRATQLTLRMASVAHSQASLDRALDAVGDPLLVVDADARVVFANAAAERLLATGDGLARERELDRRGGALRAAVPQETAALRRLIAGASATSMHTANDDALPNGGTLALARPSGRAPLVALVAPYRRASIGGMSPFAAMLDDASRGSAIVSILDPSHVADIEQPSRWLLEVLRTRFALTATEAMVAVEIADGDGLAAVAAARGVSLATVRAQAQRIYDKTGVRGQLALVRLVTRLRATLGFTAAMGE